jgi:hypothetical protein
MMFPVQSDMLERGGGGKDSLSDDASPVTG